MDALLLLIPSSPPSWTPPSSLPTSAGSSELPSASQSLLSELDFDSDEDFPDDEALEDNTLAEDDEAASSESSDGDSVGSISLNSSSDDEDDGADLIDVIGDFPSSNPSELSSAPSTVLTEDSENETEAGDDDAEQLLAMNDPNGGWGSDASDSDDTLTPTATPVGSQDAIEEETTLLPVLPPSNDQLTASPSGADEFEDAYWGEPHELDALLSAADSIIPTVGPPEENTSASIVVEPAAPIAAAHSLDPPVESESEATVVNEAVVAVTAATTDDNHSVPADAAGGVPTVPTVPDVPNVEPDTRRIDCNESMVMDPHVAAPNPAPTTQDAKDCSFTKSDPPSSELQHQSGEIAGIDKTCKGDLSRHGFAVLGCKRAVSPGPEAGPSKARKVDAYFGELRATVLCEWIYRQAQGDEPGGVVRHGDVGTTVLQDGELHVRLVRLERYTESTFMQVWHRAMLMPKATWRYTHHIPSIKAVTAPTCDGCCCESVMVKHP
ncbi:hypothetical protein V8E36_009680 [Tilletia maclaganii]